MTGSPSRVAAAVDSKPHLFFEEIRRAFDLAVRTTGIEQRFFRLNGQTIRMCFAGPALVPLITSALQHLEIEPQQDQSLTVGIWDDYSTGKTMPPPPWGDSYPYTRRGDLRGYNNEEIHTAYNITAGSLSVFHRTERLAFYWTRDVSQLPGYETSAPLRTILHWWSGLFDSQFVHAAAVGNREGGVLLAGKGGSGKSSTALQCIISGLRYVSDDYCMINLDPGPSATCLYSSAKLNPEDLDRFPSLIPSLANRERLPKEKAVFFLYQHFQERILHSFPIRAILLPHRTEKMETTIWPASSLEAFRALALSTMSQLAAAGERSISFMHRLVQLLPSYHFGLGTDRSRIPNVIREILESS